MYSSAITFLRDRLVISQYNLASWNDPVKQVLRIILWWCFTWRSVFVFFFRIFIWLKTVLGRRDIFFNICTNKASTYRFLVKKQRTQKSQIFGLSLHTWCSFSRALTALVFWRLRWLWFSFIVKVNAKRNGEIKQ